MITLDLNDMEIAALSHLMDDGGDLWHEYLKSHVESGESGTMVEGVPDSMILLVGQSLRGKIGDAIDLKPTIASLETKGWTKVMTLPRGSVWSICGKHGPNTLFNDDDDDGGVHCSGVDKEFEASPDGLTGTQLDEYADKIYSECYDSHKVVLLKEGGYNEFP